MDHINKSLHTTIKLNLRYPINEIVAWGIFGDETFLKPDQLLYSNYSESNINTVSLDPDHIELINNIEEDIKKIIAENSHKVDFSTMSSTQRDIEKILDKCIKIKFKDLAPRLLEKKVVFKGYPVWWASLIVSYREMAIFAFNNDNYYIAMQLSEACRDCQARMIFRNVVFIEEHKKELSKRLKETGAKGGSQKGFNYQEPKEKALNYHDKHFSKKNENGKFVYSNALAAREIVSHFDKKGQSLGYADNSLANIISKHRKQHFT